MKRTAHLYFLISVISFISFAANAAIYTSTTNGRWEDAGTWSPPGPPGPNDSVVIAGGTTVSIDNQYGPRVIKGVTVESGAVLEDEHPGGGVSLSTDYHEGVTNHGTIRTKDGDSLNRSSGSVVINGGSLNNSGTIQTGAGHDSAEQGEDAGDSGSIQVHGKNVTNSGTLKTGNGGSATDEDLYPGNDGGKAGDVTLEGTSETVSNSGNIQTGNGGDSNYGKAGDGGSVGMSGTVLGKVENTETGQIQAGNGGSGGAGGSGAGGSVSIDSDETATNAGSIEAGKGGDAKADTGGNGGQGGNVEIKGNGYEPEHKTSNSGTVNAGNGGWGSSNNGEEPFGGVGNGGNGGSVSITNSKKGEYATAKAENSGNVSGGIGGMGGYSNAPSPYGEYGGHGGHGGGVTLKGKNTRNSGILTGGWGGDGGIGNEPGDHGGDGGNGGDVTVAGNDGEDSKADTADIPGSETGGSPGSKGVAASGPAADGADGKRGDIKVKAKKTITTWAGSRKHAGYIDFSVDDGVIDLTSLDESAITGEQGVVFRSRGRIDLRGNVPGTFVIQSLQGDVVIYVVDESDIQLDSGVNLEDIISPPPIVISVSEEIPTLPAWGMALMAVLLIALRIRRGRP